MAPDRSKDDELILVNETRRGGSDSRASSTVPASPGAHVGLELSPRRFRNHSAHGWSVQELRQAIIECAISFGWHSPAAPHNGKATDARPPEQLAGLVYMPPPGVASTWADLTLIRRRDRRLVLAALLSDRTTARLSARKRLVMDLLGSLQRDKPPDGRRWADLSAGPAVPTIQVFVWRPSDLVAGIIADVLR